MSPANSLMPSILYPNQFFVYSLLQRFRYTGSYEAKKKLGGAQLKITPDDEVKIWAIIEDKPDLALEKIKQSAHLQVSTPTIFRAIKRMNIIYKKQKTLYLSEQKHPRFKL